MKALLFLFIPFLMLLLVACNGENSEEYVFEQYVFAEWWDNDLLFGLVIGIRENPNNLQSKMMNREICNLILKHGQILNNTYFTAEVALGKNKNPHGNEVKNLIRKLNEKYREGD